MAGLSTTLTRADSPLARTGRKATTAAARHDSGLSAGDQESLKRVFEEKYEYIDNDLFHEDPEEAQRLIFDEAPEIPKPDTSWYHPVMDTYTAVRQTKNMGSVLLTAKQERALFLQYNYCRFRVCEIRDELRDQHQMDKEKARELLRWFYKAENLREQIANTNLALVLAMAKRTRMSEVDFADLISEGNMALLRAVDKFDAARGFKFSTYACRAILKAFSRQGVKLSKYRAMFPTDFDPALEKSNHAENKRAEHEDDCVTELKDIIHDNKADLSEIERQVIVHRFAIGKKSEKPRQDAQPLTLEQVGRIIGVTKERVRQIQNKALTKLRVSLEDDFLG
jgi:RNA polymerase primary sigma factor